jgi:hypothetical protein
VSGRAVGLWMAIRMQARLKGHAHYRDLRAHPAAPSSRSIFSSSRGSSTGLVS